VATPRTLLGELTVFPQIPLLVSGSHTSKGKGRVKRRGREKREGEGRKGKRREGKERGGKRIGGKGEESRGREGTGGRRP